MLTEADLVPTLIRVAERTLACSYRCWGFGESVAMLGLVAATRATGERRFQDFVEAAFTRWWVTRNKRLSFEDHVTPGLALLLLARNDSRWMDVAVAVAELLRGCPEVAGIQVHRPDLERWSTHIWVDCLYTEGAFLALLGRVSGDSAWEDLACAHTLAYVEALWDSESGLFFHSYDARTCRTNGVRWGRGNGWALLGLIDLLRFLRPHRTERRRFVEVVQCQVERLAALQNPSGHWHTVLDRSDTYLESSVAAMMAWAIPQAIRLGVIPGRFLATAEAAFRAALHSTGKDGSLNGVSEATPSAEDVKSYVSRRTGVYPWGQGPWLLALADRVLPDGIWEGLP
jgi:unsaturated rhamnogalacturonyl hydrolase